MLMPLSGSIRLACTFECVLVCKRDVGQRLRNNLSHLLNCLWIPHVVLPGWTVRVDLQARVHIKERNTLVTQTAHFYSAQLLAPQTLRLLLPHQQ